MSGFSEIGNRMLGGIRRLFGSKDGPRPNEEQTQTAQAAQSVWVLFREPGQVLVASLSFDESRFNCYGEKFFKLEYNANSDEIAAAVAECLAASRDRIPKAECETINEKFYAATKTNQKQLDSRWDLISVDLDLKSKVVTVCQMHRIRKSGGHAGDPNEPKFTFPVVDDWSPVGTEIRRLLDMGAPDPISL